jgi:hypothetical protein
MATAYGALCTDFFVNQKLSLLLDLPSERETILGLFDRIRKERPQMHRLRRLDGELSLESKEDEPHYEWLALRRTSIRSGSVNPEALEDASKLHEMILHVAPFFLTISPIDIEYLEVVFGFDLETEANRNEVAFDALMGDAAIAGIVDRDRDALLDCQPYVSFALDESRQTHAIIDVKTRVRASEQQSGRFQNNPITVYCTVRRHGPFKSVDELPQVFGRLMKRAERLADERVVPKVLMPIRDVIMSRPG